MRPVTLARIGTVALALAIPAASSAQYYLPAGEVVHERIFEIHPLAGWFLPDQNSGYPDGSPLIGFRGTVNNSERWALEGQVAWAFRQQQDSPRGTVDSYVGHPVFNSAGFVTGVVITDLRTSEVQGRTGSDLLMLGGSVVLNLSDRNLRPFLSGGAGFIEDFGNDGSTPGPFSDLYLDFGVGLKFYRSTGFGWRVDVHDVLLKKDDLPRGDPDAALIAAQYDWSTGGGVDGVPFREPYTPVEYRGRRWLHNVGVSVSVTFPFAWAWKDGDGDQVATRFDQCPTTAPNVVVDAVGCGIDSDQDGIFDGLDECVETPKGAIVDRFGCPSDIDGDGVLDGIDLDDNTPAGALVDALGRHTDSDGDGILDGLDECNDTPRMAAVDSKGCTADPMEDTLLRGTPILVEDVRFEPGSAEIDPRSYRALNRVARLVERWTGHRERPVRIEVGVHARRSEGTLLTQRRAERLRIYFLENFFGMGANNLVAKGYSADEGAGDGRVEVRFVGEGDPPQEYDFGASDERIAPITPVAPGAGEAPPPPPEIEDIPEPEMPEIPDIPEPEMPDLGDPE